ncbi:substrate-binding domain-containing protein [Saccharothrix sp. Mg75]|uniref:substrate-binding domain-containing protein n=1 Tax=Saccharothrix sp. Mg75 TaxID=3445357 RepID=UPI003EEA36E1
MRAVPLLVVLALLAACTPAPPATTTLTVLASTELADLAPVLDDLRRDTGVSLRVEHRGTVRASEDLAAGPTGHDLAWLSTDRYLRLRTRDLPLSTTTMLTPLVLGVKRAKAAGLRAAGPPSWADLAGHAAAGRLRFGMADPRVSGSGLGALIGVATAAAGTGAALRPEDVACDRLQGFLTGRVRAADGGAEEYARHEDQVDALVAQESEVLALNASGRLREPLEVVYPRDGIVLSDHPLMLLDPGRRAAYDRVVAWLRGEGAQRAVMERTWRRPVDPDLPRPAPLREPLGTSLYFPAAQEVVDALLAAYDRAGRPSRVVFVLDHSTSMAGARIDGLRAAFATLSRAGGFEQFRVGETVVVVRFAGSVLEEREVTVRGAGDLDALATLLDGAELVDGTALWSALDHAYRVVGEGGVVLMTDGENNAGMSADDLLAAWPSPPARTYAVRFGEADPAELDRVARASGGRVVDATDGSLTEAVREVRGCR